MNVDEKVILLMSCLEIPSHKQQELLSLYGNANAMWTGFSTKRDKVREILSDKDSTRLAYSLCQDYLDSVQKDLNDNDVVAVTIESELYPENLCNIAEPPMTLFCKGNLSLLSSQGIAVVGTRKVSSYGKKVTINFATEIAKNMVVVSGLAYGVDTLAHEAALLVGGKTIAVLGSGLNVIYPSANENLAKRIVENNGLLISEFPLNATPQPYHFPMRNRIVAGLSRGILITEAPLKSGTMSTLEHALNQGKDVFVVPGEIYSPNSSGCNEVLKRMQGALVTEPKDILDCYNILYKNTKKDKIQLDFTEQIVVDLLNIGKAHFDELITKSNLTSQELNYVLSSLELKGCVVRLPGNYFQYMED